MITQAMLYSFIWRNHPRRELRGIIHRGGYLYATDSRVIIRVPYVEGINCISDGAPKNMAELIDRHTCGPLLPFPPLPTPEPCHECGGDGCIRCDDHGVSNFQPVDIGGVSFNRRYLALLSRLPSIRFAISPEMEGSNPKHRMHPMYFMFESGEGVLMPVIT